MRLYSLFFQHRLIWTVLLALIGIVIMIYYASCKTCSILQGDIFGMISNISVWVMGLIILLALFQTGDLIHAYPGRHRRRGFSGFLQFRKIFFALLPVSE